jgi:hypothetical protein
MLSAGRKLADNHRFLPTYRFNFSIAATRSRPRQPAPAHYAERTSDASSTNTSPTRCAGENRFESIDHLPPRSRWLMPEANQARRACQRLDRSRMGYMDCRAHCSAGACRLSRVRNAKPHGSNRRASGNAGLIGRAHFTARCGQSATDRLPANWRAHLPEPATYFAAHVARLSRPNATGWAQGVCPLHDDRNASLSVNVTHARGGWRCFAGCGSGDLIGFHQRLTGKDFKAAVADLVRV